MKHYKNRIFIIILIIIISLSMCNPNVHLEGYETNEIGFIITRHVNSKDTNKVWKMCINQLRKVYTNEKIVIIDDNSNYDFITNTDVDLTNCKIIDSEFKKRGELLPYYYYYKHKWFDNAIFIHDSVFINNQIPVSKISDVKFLWYFNGGEYEDPHNIERILRVLNYKDELISRFRDKSSWKGCWGVMSIIKYDFLKKIFEKYDMSRLLDVVHNREDRMAMERIFGIICIYEKPELFDDPSIFGYYKTNQNNRKSSDYSYDEYLEDINNNQMRCNINKLFFGR